jgi:hypothetical protein
LGEIVLAMIVQRTASPIKPSIATFFLRSIVDTFDQLRALLAPALQHFTEALRGCILGIRGSARESWRSALWISLSSRSTDP